MRNLVQKGDVITFASYRLKGVESVDIQKMGKFLSKNELATEDKILDILFNVDNTVVIDNELHVKVTMDGEVLTIPARHTKEIFQFNEKGDDTKSIFISTVHRNTFINNNWANYKFQKEPVGRSVGRTTLVPVDSNGEPILFDYLK